MTTMVKAQLRSGRVVMIGLDGADLPFIQDSVGALPNLGRLLSPHRPAHIKDLARFVTGSLGIAA